MKRILCALWALFFLTACAAEPQEIPQEVPAPEPVVLEPVIPEPEQAEPVFSPVNPKPSHTVSMRLGERRAFAYGELVEIPAAPFLEHDTFYFPLQFVAEAMGVQYAFSDGCAYLQCDGHVTQFFIDSPRFVVDGVEGQAEGERTLFREGLPHAPVDEHFTPLLRDGIVFLPVDYLPVEFRRSYNSFGAQICPVPGNNEVYFRNDRFPPTEAETAVAVTLCPNVAGALVDGERTPLPVAPFVENEIFYFPVETVAELLGVGYSRTGDTFCLFNSEYNVQLFLNSRQYILNGQTGRREGQRTVFAPGHNHTPVDDGYTPVERDGAVFLPSDYLAEMECYFFEEIEYFEYPETGMVIFSNPYIEEQGIGGFYLWHKFDETPPELRAGLHCTGKLGEYEGEYDIMDYAGYGLNVHVLRLKPGEQNTGWYDGVISAVSTTSPEFATPRGLRCGDMPRRAWELYGYEFAHMLCYECPDNGPITAIGFICLKEETLQMDTPYIPFVPDVWFETPAFWES